MKIIRSIGLFGMVLGAIFLFGNAKAVNGQERSMDWRGTVDDHVQIVITGRNATVRTLSGTAYNDSRFDFNGRGGGWGNNQSMRASVDKQDGRGKVRVVQQPNRRNNNTTIIQVDDTKGGADRYRFRVTRN